MTRFSKKAISIATSAAIVLMAPVFAPAAPAVHPSQCNLAGTQVEMNACAVDELAQADRQLNEVYQALLKKEAKNTQFIQKLRTAQRAWVAFRNAELDAMYACAEPNATACWGSLLPVRYTSYKAKLTCERTERLRRLLKEGPPADDSSP